MPSLSFHLWYDREARAAAEFYVSLFPRSKVNTVHKLSGTPSGDVELVSWQLAGLPFQGMSAGPLFHFNPSISLMVMCETAAEVDTKWEELAPGGKALMPLGEYPFSRRFGWTADRFGLSWQLMFAPEVKWTQKITPVLMFTRAVAGQAEAAMNQYAAVFGGARPNIRARHGGGEGADAEGTVTYGTLELLGWDLGFSDSAGPHDFSFNEAISLAVSCDTQEEIDHYWNGLAADPAAGQCGWLKDRFGVSWQIVPAILGKLLAGDDAARRARVTQAFLKMKKFNLAALERAAGQ